MDWPVPILVVSDAPCNYSGLARVTRDLCMMLCAQPEWRVATLGWLAHGSARLPWTQYSMSYGGFGERDLAGVWDEFSGGKPGVILTIWDLHRILWLARPDFIEDTRLRKDIERVRSQCMLWSYVPIDATCAGGRLTGMAQSALLGIDRLLAYTPWASEQIELTIGEHAAAKGLTWMPHMYNSDTFKPDTSVTPAKCVGVVATNQSRKDWALVAAIARGTLERYPDVKWWWHTDALIREWSLPALVEDYALGDSVEVTLMPLHDHELADRYRACACTVAPGLGEGFGLPIIESLACGTPVVHGDYAGGASIMRSCGLDAMLIQPITYRSEGRYNTLRPVYDPTPWIEVVCGYLEHPLEDRKALAQHVEHLAWDKLKPVWAKWFRDGLGVTRG